MSSASCLLQISKCYIHMATNVKAICRNAWPLAQELCRNAWILWTGRDKHLPLAWDRDKLPLKVNAVDWRLKAEADGVWVLPQRIVDQVPAELIPEHPDVVAMLVVNGVVHGHVYLAILSHHCGFCKQG